MVTSGDLKYATAAAGASFQGEPSVWPSSIAHTLVIFPWKWVSCSGRVSRVEEEEEAEGVWGRGGSTFRGQRFQQG